MHFLISKSDLQSALAEIGPFVDSKGPNPLLSSVHIEAGERLRLTTTNVSQWATVELSATVVDRGSVCVDHGSLFAMVKGLGDDVVDIRLDNRLIVSQGTTTARLCCLDGADFPAAPPVSGDVVTIDGKALCEAIAKVAHCVAPDTRYALNGMLVEPVGDSLRLVATDGNRLAYADIEGVTASWPRNRLLPRAVLAVIKDLSGPVDLLFSDRSARLTACDLSVTFRLLEADFPDYRQVIPGAFAGRIVADRDALVGALKRVGVLGAKTAAVALTMSEEELGLLCQTFDAGDVTTSIPARCRTNLTRIGFNRQYALDALAAMPAGEVTWETGTTLSPTRMAAPGVCQIIMPVNLT